MTHDQRKPVAYLRATVEFPLYEGDDMEHEFGWNDFVYEEPGITAGGELGTCRRDCKTLTAEVIKSAA